MKKTTAIKKLRKKELEATLSNSRGFSFNLGSGDPRESLLSQTNRATVLSKITREISKVALPDSELVKKLSELTLENKLLNEEVNNLRSLNKRLTKQIKGFISIGEEAAKVGGISKSEILGHNKSIASKEYLLLSKDEKVTAKRLFDHLTAKFPTKVNDHELKIKRPEIAYDPELKPWRFGTIRGWHKELKN